MKNNNTRPLYYNDNVIKKTVDAIWPDIHKWLSAGGWDGDGFEITRHKKMLGKAIQFENCSYQIAKKLDSWNPDYELITIFEDIYYIKLACHEEEVKNWVKENNIVSNLSVGDKISALKIFEGVISEVKTDTAQYVVDITYEGGEKHHKIFNYEEVEKIDNDLL